MNLKINTKLFKQNYLIKLIFFNKKLKKKTINKSKFILHKKILHVI